MNGHSIGFFPCNRGVRQGDPLSSLLFYLAEDVLSRRISYLIDTGQLKPMAGPRNFQTLSHVLYVDDIMVFYKGTQQES